ncbi:hypothetical protein GN958_ATG10551 [Phytophthora infestans]|uniref:Uncharacterized protein n=1 Tax=Phytophthora infestans TaxID=4787 RepID=A0A8S9UID6_PHYIN|nr:hypothetical protein GN958_ATG10551 [Phytophthora infestans]
MAAEDNEHSAKLHRLVFACDVLEVESLLLSRTFGKVQEATAGEQHKPRSRLSMGSSVCEKEACPVKVTYDL